MKRKLKVDIWENGCGANVGKHILHFTGIDRYEKDTISYGVYVTLKNPDFICHDLLYIPNRSRAALRDVIKRAIEIRDIIIELRDGK